MNTMLILAFALGMRHAVDPDHLTAIDGLSRIRPKATNGLYFAIGHGLVVTVLAAGIGTTISGRMEFLGPWLLILIGVINLWRLLRRTPAALPTKRPLIAQPFLLGMILAAGFETASQLSVFLLAGHNNPWILGAAFSGGMVLVDGLDGYLAASTQWLAAKGKTNAQLASQFLGLVVVLFSFGLGGAEILGFNADRFALQLGLLLFTVVIATRVWGRSGQRFVAAEAILSRLRPTLTNPQSQA